MTLPSLLRTGSRWSRAAVTRSRPTSRATSTLTASSENPALLNSILIANRGEIALYVCERNVFLDIPNRPVTLLITLSVARRVGRTATQHGIKVTTLYTNPDSKAQHALSSPYAFNLGETAAYLDGDRIIEIAKREGCQGIHPGYGFVRTNYSCDITGQKYGLLTYLFATAQ